MNFKISHATFFIFWIIILTLGMGWLCYQACLYWKINHMTAGWLFLFASLTAIAVTSLFAMYYADRLKG